MMALASLGIFSRLISHLDDSLFAWSPFWKYVRDVSVTSSLSDVNTMAMSVRYFTDCHGLRKLGEFFSKIPPFWCPSWHPSSARHRLRHARPGYHKTSVLGAVFSLATATVCRETWTTEPTSDQPRYLWMGSCSLLCWLVYMVLRKIGRASCRERV